MMTGVRFGSVLCLAAGSLALQGGCEHSVKDSDIRLIQATEVRALVDRHRAGERDVLLIIDPRPQEKFAAGHLPGARNMSPPPVEAGGNDPGLTPYVNLVVAGDNPADARAPAMAKRLLQLRYRGVRLFAGGVEEWARLGYPVETGGP